MSTNSIIGIKDGESGTVSGVYCHRDGYPGGVGITLARHYQDEEKAKRLVALGDLSSLGEEVDPPAGASHTFEDPLPGVTVAYARDRGEERSPNFSAESVRDFLRKIPSMTYTYIFEDGEWMLYIDNHPAGLRLATALAGR